MKKKEGLTYKNNIFNSLSKNIKRLGVEQPVILQKQLRESTRLTSAKKSTDWLIFNIT